MRSSINSGPVWTWRVTTPAGVIYVRGVNCVGAVRAAGMFGAESVQPATADEALAVTPCAILDNLAGEIPAVIV